MKNFFKKLSFVLASAMVITSLYAPANAEAASNFVRVKGSKKAVTSKDIFVGGRKVNFDYTIGKKMTGIHGTWTSSDTSVAVVDKKTGVVKAVSNGTATITFKTKKTKSMKKVVTIKTTVNTFTRAKAVELSTATAEVKLGESLDVTASLISIDKAGSSNSTYNLVASSSDENIATAKVDGTTISISPIATGSATFTVFARHKNGDKYDTPKVELTVTVIANLSAKQSAANKITVMGADLSDKAEDYVLKNDKGIIQNAKSVKVNDAKTEAVFEAYVIQIPEGKYTLTYQKENSVDVDIVKAVSKEIKVTPEDKAVIVDDTDPQRAYVYYSVLDQFGNDITANVDLNATGDFAPAVDRVKRTITFTNTNKFIPSSTKINAVLVDKANGTNTVLSLTAAVESKLSELVFKGVLDIDNKKIVESITDSADLSKFVLLFEGKDQYGVAYNKAGDSEKANVFLETVTRLQAKTNKLNDVATFGDKKYYRYILEELSDTVPVQAGEVTVKAIAVNSGKTSSGKFEVTNAKKVVSISVSEGAGIYSEQENVLSYSAMDADGNQVTDYKLLKEVKAAVSGGAGTLDWSNDNGKAVLTYTPSTGLNVTDNTTVPVSMLFTTKENKVFPFLLNVKTERKPAAVIGLDKDVVTGVTQGGKLEIDYTKFMFQDQFGYPMSYDQVKEYNTRNAAKFKGYALLLTLSENAGGKFEALANATTAHKIGDTVATKPSTTTTKDAPNAIVGVATGKIEVSLLENKKEGAFAWDLNAGSEADKPKKVNTYGYAVYRVHLDSLKDFAIEKKDVYAVHDVEGDPTSGGTAGNAYKVIRPTVVGFYDGKKIALNTAKDFKVIGGVDVNNATAADIEYFARLAKDDIDETKNEKSKTKKVQLVIANKAGTTIEADYLFKEEKRAVVKLELKKKGVIDGASSSMDVTTLLGKFNTVDQYGEDKLTVDPAKAFVTYSNIEDLNVANNGLPSATVELKNTGDSIRTRVRIILEGNPTPVFDEEVTIKK